MKKFTVYPNNCIESIEVITSTHRITCAISSRDMSSQLIKTKSSNIDSFGMNIRDRHDKTGDVVVKFKATKTSPSDMYIYYDVPVKLWKQWLTTTSKGHFFWKFIRNNFTYRKLTGDKKTHLPNGL